MKKAVFTSLLAFFSVISFAQTLFTYGSNAVTKAEFLKAFNKNPGTGENRKEALNDYLDLYINYKLKVKAAYDEKLQNKSTQISELNNFRRQIADNYINEAANIGGLVNQAFERSQKDIHLAQVFVEFSAAEDTMSAYKQIQAALQEINSGKNFNEVAAAYSTDAYTKQAGGDLGYVTVFTLPYQFENVAYHLKPGNYSAPFRSALGYHIFKHLGERKALGALKVAQILIAWPPNSSSVEKEAAAKKADSVYSLLQGGASFSELAQMVSNDVSSAYRAGQLAEVRIGMYDSNFEKAAYQLRKPGEFTKPFATSFGYHILQLIEKLPVETNKLNLESMAALEEKVRQDERIEQAKKWMIQKQMSKIGYKSAQLNQKELWRFTDSMLQNRKDITNKIIGNTILFSFAKQNITAQDWLNFVKAKHANSAGAPVNYSSLLKEFKEISATNYYRDHLDDYNQAFKQQLQEFKEANLLFGVMETKVWSKANTDTAGLRAFFEKNNKRYLWEASADALVITVNNDSIVSDLRKKFENAPASWRTIVDEYGGQVTADSGRFELGQLPVVDRTNFQPALLTAPVVSETDGTVTFNYIFSLHDAGEPRNFEDAKGIIISDYQEMLEKDWLAQLKKKYPVKVNRAVFNSIK